MVLNTTAQRHLLRTAGSLLVSEIAAAPLQSEVTHLALGQRGVSPRPSAHPGAPKLTTINY